MANNYTKTMRQALEEARSFRDVATEGGPGSGPQKGGKKHSSADIKKAYGILNDPRYKQGNYSGAAKAIDKLSPGLSNHPDVKNAMKRANENLDLPATGDTTTSNASQEAEQVELDKEWAIMSERTYTMKYDVATGKPFPQTAPPGTDGGNRNPYLAGRSAAKSGKKYSDNPHKVAAKKLYWSKGYIDYKKNPGKNEELDEAKFTPAQVSALKDKYGKLGPGAEKNAVQMDKLAKMMSKYSKSHLSQLADLDIPMVSKVAKELMKEEVAEGGPGSGPQKGGVKKPKKSGLGPLKIPGASKHMGGDKSKKVSMAKTPAKFGGDYYDQEDREELAYLQKVNTNKQPAWKLKKYGVTADGELAKGWKPDDQLKG